MGEITRDTVIIGGGIAGLMCAFALSARGHRVTVIEANKIVGGVTKNTTAHIDALHAKYAKIPTRSKRKKYMAAQLDGVEGLADIIKAHNIDCDFVRVRSITEKHSLENQARFDAVKFLRGLPKDFEIIENTRIKNVCLWRKLLYTDDLVIKARRIVIATNFPIVNIRGLYAFKMYKSTSYAVAIKTDERIGCLFNSIHQDGLTFRDTADGIIMGGLDHRTGRQRDAAPGIFRTGWNANDCITFDGVPYAGRFKRFFSRDIYVVTGFNKFGMTNSWVGAQIIADLVDGNKNKYARLYKPTRILNVLVWHKVLWNAIQDVGHIVAGLVLGHRCPHMLCRMQWNPSTKTWDCPCHGSRLDEDGEIITAPTVKRKKF